jgi:ribosomal protein S18 acetylase RimI-like enzyme
VLLDASENDIHDVVDVHLLSFNGFFLSLMGPMFLNRYYGFLLKKQGAVFLVDRESEVHGFICGVADAGMLNREFVRGNIIIVLIAAINAMLHHPSIIKRIFTRVRDNSHFPNEKKTIHLLSLAVRPSASRRGVGTLLMEEFIRRAKALGFLRIYLTTDRYENDSVNAFYRNIGFALMNSYNSGNMRIMNEYMLSLE